MTGWEPNAAATKPTRQQQCNDKLLRANTGDSVSLTMTAPTAQDAHEDDERGRDMGAVTDDNADPECGGEGGDRMPPGAMPEGEGQENCEREEQQVGTWRRSCNTGQGEHRQDDGTRSTQARNVPCNYNIRKGSGTSREADDETHDKESVKQGQEATGQLNTVGARVQTLTDTPDDDHGNCNNTTDHSTVNIRDETNRVMQEEGARTHLQ